ncbi:MAG TPA: polysaccharide biosynthesis/export family protein [Flavisolibacter sp.]|nr:polysaccharide biosynthesis/export family protein [Flavisolibacter sp.]
MTANNLLKTTGLLWLVLFFCSCDSSKRINKDYLLFQNDRQFPVKAKLHEMTIKAKDQLVIQIYSNSLNQEQVAIFTLAGQNYLVDQYGKIEMPIIGQITAAGLTLEGLQQTIKGRLAAHVKDPSVNVRFQGITVTVLGEVGGPGPKIFQKDQVTILDAIAASGDLAPTGLRENVTVIRDYDGVKKIHEIDLRSVTLFESPVYQLQQNDIVYVNANKTKLKALKEQKTNITQILQTGLSIFGVVTSIYLLFRN